MLRIYCPGCGKLVRGGDDWAGVTGSCPNCKSAIRFPKSEITCDENDEFASVIADSANRIHSTQTVNPPLKSKSAANRFRAHPQDGEQIAGQLLDDLGGGVALPQANGDTTRHSISPREFILNCIPSQDTNNDYRVHAAREAGWLAAPQPLPESVDLRAPWWKVGNQEKTGSCVGWATADSVLRWYFVNVEPKRLETDELLSPRFIWMAAKEKDEFVSKPSSFIESDGTSLKAALDIARDYGAVTDTTLPVASMKLYQGSVDDFYATAALLKIRGYINLRPDKTEPRECLREWREWLAFKGPILTRLNVDDTWYDAAKTEGKLDVYQSPGGGHAVALVGYTQDRFIVRNSWGPDWGDQGFGYATEEYAVAAFTEAYGVFV